jgi:hypothetical protein
MMDQYIMYRTERIVELGMSTGMRARMATMQMRRMQHWKLRMDARRMWMTEDIVLESVMIRQYISDLENPIMAKQMQRQAMYPKQGLYYTM